MSRTFDPLVAVAGACLVGSVALGLWYLSADQDVVAQPATPAGRAHPRPAATDAPPAGDSAEPAAADARPATQDGWIPPTAGDAIAKDKLGSPRLGGQNCEDSGDVIDLAKDTAGQFEQQLRKATAISDAEESQIGEKIERLIPGSPQFHGKWDQPADVAKYKNYVQSMVDHLLQHGSRRGLNYRVHVVHDENFNAFAMPGGIIGVNIGLFEGKTALHNEAELAVVLAHEIAHVEKHHPVAAYQYAKLLLGPAADEGQILVQMLQMPIASEYEHAADKRGLALAAQAQYDPFAACQLWQRMATTADHAGASDDPVDVIAGAVLDTAGRLLETHPPPRQRCARTQIAARALVDKGAFARYYRGQRNLRERVLGPAHPY